MTDAIIEYVAESVVRQLRLKRMLFVQATANVEDRDGALEAEICSRLASSTGLDVCKIAVDDSEAEVELEGKAIVLTNLAVAANRRLINSLANLRPRLVSAVENGSLLLILSSVPRLRLLGSVGSMVTMDCAYFRFEKEIDDAADHLLSGLESGDQEGVRSWSQLQPALLRRFNAIARSGESNTKKLAASNAALAEVMGRALAQLGPEIAAWLEYWLFEYQEAAPGRVDVPDDILEALLGAGLATVDAVSDEVRLASGPARERVEEALRDYLARVLEPPARWSDLVEALFTLERMVRLAVKREMTDHFGQDWREHIPNGPAAKATSRASADVPAYSSVKAIPNPLDWMTLSELAQVADYCCVEFKCVAGIRAEVWRSLFTEVEPIRNRAAHMRLMRLGDLDSARRWGRQLRMRSPGSFED